MSLCKQMADEYFKQIEDVSMCRQMAEEYPLTINQITDE